MTEAATPAVGRRLHHLDFAVLALYWIAIGYLWQSLGTLIIPDAVRACWARWAAPWWPAPSWPALAGRPRC
jgi:hypothetical protein